MGDRIQEQFAYWTSDPYFDDATKQELLAIRNDEKEVEDRFYKDLAFFDQKQNYFRKYY